MRVRPDTRDLAYSLALELEVSSGQRISMNQALMLGLQLLSKRIQRNKRRRKKR